jgi:hypothetical protein
MQDVAVVARALAALPEVTWVDVQMPLQLMDLNAAAVLQAPQLINTAYPGPTVSDGLRSPQSAQHFPFWQAGIDGSGQVR